MPGTSYCLERAFIDELNLRQRDECNYVLYRSSLKEMIAGRSEALKDGNLDKLKIYNAAILTKITYFEPMQLDEDMVMFLCSLASKCLNTPNPHPAHLSQFASRSYRMFSDWARRAHHKIGA
jgi:hypothetical protein